MVRAGAPTPSKRKEKEVASASAEDKADEMESKRLRDLAFSRGLLSRTKSHAQHPSLPSKTILNSDGRDIVKKGHRKSKYLFAFPGLMAPVAGGKLGELTNLDSKNPVLYVDFPQGRLKLFGTIVYPKNKYLTLHFPRGAGNIVCEDCFESLVVFSIAWWIGTKEQNPEEVRIPLPKSFKQDKHADFDFTAGAGQAKDSNTTKHQKEKAEAASQPNLKPKPEVSESETSGKDTEAHMANQPVRQSARMAGRKLKYADSSSDKENDSDGSDSVESQQILKTGGKKQLLATKEVSNKVDVNDGGSSGTKATIILDGDVHTPGKKKAGTSAAERNLSSELEPVITSDFKSFTAAAKTPPGGSSGKVSVLKQSRLEAFHQKSALQEERTTIVIEASTPETNHKVTANVSKSSAKRSRKIPKEDNTEGSCSEDSDNDFLVGKGTPSKGRKRVKSEGGAGVNKGASAIAPTTLHSKTILSPKKKRIEKTSSRKEKKSATETASKGGGSASKGKKSAVSRAAGVKPSKKSSDSEEELSKSDDMSDDSDEDWVG